MEYALLCPGYFHQNIHPCSGTADSRQNSVSLECESYGGAICRGSRNLIELSSPPCPGWHSPINDKNICIHWKIFQLSTSRSCTDWQQTVHAATPATNCCCVPDGSQFATIRDGHCERVWQKASLDPTMTVMNPHYDGSGQSRMTSHLNDHFRTIKNKKVLSQSHERRRWRLKSDMTNLFKWLHCVLPLFLLWQKTFNLTSHWSLHDIEHRKDRTGYMYRVFV